MNETFWPCLFLSKLKPKIPKNKCYLNCGVQFKLEKGKVREHRERRVGLPVAR